MKLLLAGRVPIVVSEMFIRVLQIESELFASYVHKVTLSGKDVEVFLKLIFYYLRPKDQYFPKGQNADFSASPDSSELKIKLNKIHLQTKSTKIDCH